MQTAACFAAPEKGIALYDIARCFYIGVEGAHALAAQKNDANAKMLVAPVKYRNPGVFSMALAFLVGILFSYIFPEKDAENKFATAKLREYVGIGAE
jgi:Na+(H+)/acetate symporter ActP